MLVLHLAGSSSSCCMQKQEEEEEEEDEEEEEKKEAAGRWSTPSGGCRFGSDKSKISSDIKSFLSKQKFSILFESRFS